LSGKLVRMVHRSASGSRATLARISPMVGGFAVGGGAGFYSGGCCGGALSAMLAVVAGRCLCKGT